ncbi:hypothetical protein BU25DRAFT_219611 [Macroventuria anomochaeta]|uniref:Uncharacterized protein n=1 Tax=Macroventuria anomochaeta TaxID=301207 RepID=A0ACB6RM19_9PLEO|nr:uncharacterized protein BU25DRAFT_219611 [Macroventuria anomochaeta]KAF2621969.1 hypothetical protein BU25DRAFT_219611 [Macroventuria anomochaeta]
MSLRGRDFIQAVMVLATQWSGLFFQVANGGCWFKITEQCRLVLHRASKALFSSPYRAVLVHRRSHAHSSRPAKAQVYHRLFTIS